MRLSDILKKLLLLTIFLLPLLGAYKDFGYEQIKVLFFILSISLISFVWLLQKPDIKLSEIGKTAAVFILILFLISITGLDFKTSFLGNPPYFQGLLVYSYLFLFCLLVKSFDIKLKTYAIAFNFSALIVSSRAIQDWVLQNAGYIVPDYAGRVVSSFGQPNFYAGFLLLTLPFSYLLYKGKNHKLSYFGLISALISVAGIFVSFSRSAILLSLILIALGLIDQLKIKRSWIVFTSVIILISSLIGLKFSSGFIGSEFSKPFSTNNPDLITQGVEKRVYLWPIFLKIGLQKPLAGYGLNNISVAYSDYFKKNKHLLFEENLNISPILIGLKDLTVDSSHSYILDLMLFSGIFGVLSWMLLVFLLLKKILSSDITLENDTLLLGLLTYLIWIQFQNQSIVQLIYFWFLVGAIDKGID